MSTAPQATATPARTKYRGRSCHQCKNTKPFESLALCGNMFEKRTRPEKRMCKKKFCETCLRKFYNIKIDDVKGKNWICPSCREVCCCAACIRHKEAQQHRQHAQMRSRSVVMATEVASPGGVANVSMGMPNFVPMGVPGGVGFGMNPNMMFTQQANNVFGANVPVAHVPTMNMQNIPGMSMQHMQMQNMQNMQHMQNMQNMQTMQAIPNMQGIPQQLPSVGLQLQNLPMQTSNVGVPSPTLPQFSNSNNLQLHAQLQAAATQAEMRKQRLEAQLRQLQVQQASVRMQLQQAQRPSSPNPYSLATSVNFAATQAMQQSQLHAQLQQIQEAQNQLMQARQQQTNAALEAHMKLQAAQNAARTGSRPGSPATMLSSLRISSPSTPPPGSPSSAPGISPRQEKRRDRRLSPYPGSPGKTNSTPLTVRRLKKRKLKEQQRRQTSGSRFKDTTDRLCDDMSPTTADMDTERTDDDHRSAFKQLIGTNISPASSDDLMAKQSVLLNMAAN